MNFKEFLDANNVEYKYFGEHNVLRLHYENNDNWVEIQKRIDELCEENHYLNGTPKLLGSDVLEVSKNPQLLIDLGFQSEPYDIIF